MRHTRINVFSLKEKIIQKMNISLLWYVSADEAEIQRAKRIFRESHHIAYAPIPNNEDCESILRVFSKLVIKIK